jgi:glycosyltransferase involved in cell wall biosynthesis
MRITVDLRSLHSAQYSGVEYYTVQLLEHLIPLDSKNQYTLLYNGWQPKQFDNLRFVNSKFVQRRFPNRVLNASMKFLGRPYLEDLAGPTDVLLAPDFNFVRVSPHTKLVQVVHDLSPLIEPSWFNLKTRAWHKFVGIRKTLRRADHIITVSEYTKQTVMAEAGIATEKITTAYIGINHELYQPNIAAEKLRFVRNKYGLPEQYLLFVGTIEPRKNLLNLVKAFEQLDSPASLVIAGKLGWNYQTLLNNIASSPKKRLIKLLGYADEADKPALIKLAKMLVWPSFFEGFGLPPLEALAVGTPVLTSHVSSLPEVVGDSALMVNPYTIEDITRAMEIGLTDTETRGILINKGLEQAKQFSWAKTATTVAEAINQLS